MGNDCKENLYEFNLLESLAEVKIEKVACGLNHVLALTRFGKVYYWGNLSKNQEIPDITFPILVDGLSDIEINDISCGEHHCAVFSRTEPNSVFTWG